MTLKTPAASAPNSIAATVNAARLFDASPIVGDAGCDGCASQFQFGVMPNSSGSSINSFGKSITARNVANDNAKIPVDNLADRANAICVDASIATLDDIPKLENAYRKTFTASDATADRFGAALLSISSTHPDPKARREAMNATDRLESFYAETMLPIFLGDVNSTSNVDENALWKQLDAELAWVDGSRDHAGASTTIALLHAHAMETNSPEIFDKLEHHNSPVVRAYFFALLKEVYRVDLDMESLWREQWKLIDHEIASYNEDHDNALDAIQLISDFAKWGVTAAKQKLFMISVFHLDEESRAFAQFLLGPISAEEFKELETFLFEQMKNEGLKD